MTKLKHGNFLNCFKTLSLQLKYMPNKTRNGIVNLLHRRILQDYHPETRHHPAGTANQVRVCFRKNATHPTKKVRYARDRPSILLRINKIKHIKIAFATVWRFAFFFQFRCQPKKRGHPEGSTLGGAIFSGFALLASVPGDEFGWKSTNERSTAEPRWLEVQGSYSLRTRKCQTNGVLL